MDEIQVPQVRWPERSPAGDWLKGASAVVVIGVDVDAESPVLARGEHYISHLTTMSHQAYGPRAGVPRILDLLDRYRLPATFFVPGVSAERWPSVMESVMERGHEIALHGFTHRHPVHLSEGEQRAEIERSLETFSRFGVQPVGYRAPNWEMTRYTLDLLGGFGLRYDSSLMDDDRPYALRSGGGATIAELPVQWLLDDWEQYAFLPEPNIGQLIEAPSKVVDLWTAELEAMRGFGSLCMLTVHPFLTGRPSRLRALEQFIQFALSRGDVRFARADEVAELVLAGQS
ncbi:polysaccharide deacetylase [Streptomyces sp. JJ66]|uniref:polysaccharide deacetylase family protein n=1 Tax=Streptomyces sp. JJ66 TaxID=2803843 RepID=UPI001C595B88|nr:polysaccharide deacetylase [Streptomyces sp. JJ66]MBW1600746.1 polysaccharide deacetylase [Streptomyces sp. JJ66]